MSGVQWLRESRGFTTLLVSRIVSRVGDVLFTLATSWVVLTTSHSVVLAALIPLAGSLPSIVFGLPLATLADRWPKKSVLVLVDCGRGLLVLSAGLLLLDHHPVTGVFVGVMGLLAVGGLLFTPAITSVFPRMVPPEHLTRANGLWAAVTSSLSIGSFAVGGLLVAWLTPAGALLVDGVSFLCSGAVLAILRLPDVRSDTEGGLLGFLRESVAGVRYLWRDSYLRRLILLIAPMNLVFGPMQIFSLVFSRLVLHLGTEGYGFIEAASGLGSVGAGLLVTRLAPRLTLQTWLRIGTWGSGVTLALTLIFRDLPVAILGYGAIWFVTTVLSVPIVSSVQRTAPAPLVGRVMQSLFLLTGGISVPLGLLLGSWAMNRFGAVSALWAQALGFGTIGVVALVARFNPPAHHALDQEYRPGASAPRNPSP